MPAPDPLNPSTTSDSEAAPVIPAAPTGEQPTVTPASQTETSTPDTTADQQKVAQGNYQAERESIIKRHSEQMNFKSTGGTGSYEMAKAGKYLVEAIKKLSGELKLLDKQYADKPKTPTSEEADTPKPITATQKLLDLLRVLEPPNQSQRIQNIEQWEREHPGQRFDEALDNACNDYRQATGTDHTRAPIRGTDPEQDALSRVETLAACSVSNGKNLRTIEDNEATTVTEAVEQVAQQVAVPR